MAMQSPFIWGNNGQQLTPSQAKAMRDVASALAAKKAAPQNLGEGLASVGDALLYNSNMARAGEAESAGIAKVQQALENARSTGGAGGYYDVLSNPWASEGQRLVAGSLLDRGYSLEDRAAEWARQDERQQDQRDYEAPVRDAQLTGLGIENEAGRLSLDQAKAGYTSLVSPEDRAAQGISPDDPRPWQRGPDGKLHDFGSGSGQSITVNTGGGTDDFYKKLDTDAGEQQAALLDAGRNATSNNMRLGQLSQLLETAPQGARGAFTQMAGSFGIPLEGLGEVQAAQALINQMVPGQRPPGSGTMSDADLALFKQSLPAIINQSGGNAKILATAKAINDYTIQQALIAESVANREISPAEGRAQQASIPNPLARIGQVQQPGQPAVISSDADYDALPSGAVFIGPDGQKRRKP